MDIEQLEIRDFVAAHRPFDRLPPEALARLVGGMSVRYVRRGATVPGQEEGEPALSLIRSGAVEIHDGEELVARLGEGDLLGHRASLHEGDGDERQVALEDTLLYRIPASAVDRLCEAHPPLARFLAPVGGARLRNAVQHRDGAADTPLNLTEIALGELLVREPLHLPPSATIREAAVLMSAENITSMLVVEGDALVGIVTDRDLRLRVIAADLDHGAPLSDIMSGAPLTADIAEPAYDTLLRMARHRIHHMPVLDGARLAGLVTVSDFVERHSTSAIYLAADIHRRDSVDGLAATARRLPAMVRNLAASNASAERVQQVVTGLLDAFAVRLLELAERDLGPPPVAYAWIVAGSQARGECTLASDQDNALILDDAFEPDAHGNYFERLARFVCEGLAACGQVICPGDVMATNPEWRAPLSAWRARFARWIDAPDPTALMHGCTFFDLRHVHGEAALAAELRQSMLARTRGNSIFLSHLAGNALSRQPPLGLFRNFVLSGARNEVKVLDLKHAGVVPIIDLARVHALAAGVGASATQARLEAAAAAGEISGSGARDLGDALTFLSDVRFRHQMRQLDRGDRPDSLVAPDDLSGFDRGHLKDAFAIVRTMQRSLGQRFGR